MAARRWVRGGAKKMRYTVLILIVFWTFTAAGQTPFLERKVTISFNDETVESSLKRLSDAAHFVFSYNPDILEPGTIITQSFVNKTVREILDEIFKGRVQYKVRGKYVILTSAEKTSSRKQPAIVSGYVVDESTGERLKDVSIYDPVTLTSTITDTYGYFEIKIEKPPSEIILSVNRQNYIDTVVAVPRDRRLVKVPIKVKKDKFEVLADSVGQKLKRFWRNQEALFRNKNIENIDDTLDRVFQVSFVPFIGSNHKMSGHVANDYSLNILGGYSRGVRKLEFGGVFNLVRSNVSGAQFAGVMNSVGGNLDGVQFAGVLNATGGYVRGGQFAGVLNITADDAQGVAIAGVGNIAAGERSPTQVGGVFNVAGGNNSSTQIGGVFNVAGGDLKGVQTAGVFNVTGKNVKGSQIAGVFNITGKEIGGTQIAGVFNVAPRVRGTQIGLINIADSVRGVPIGFMSIVGKGYHKIEVSADEIFYNNLAFRTGVRAFHNIFHVGARPSTYSDEKTIWTFGYGVGTTARLARKLFLDFDLTSNQIVEGNTIEALNLLNRAYLGLDFQAFGKLSINAGATLNGWITERDYDAYPSMFTHYEPNIFYERNVGRNNHMKMWVGAKVGIRFF